MNLTNGERRHEPGDDSARTRTRPEIILDGDEDFTDEDDDDEAEYLYYEAKKKKLSGAEIVLASAAPTAAANDTTLAPNASVTTPTTTRAAASSTAGSTRSGKTVVGEAKSRKTVGAAATKLLTTFAEPLFALQQHQHPAPLFSDYVFKIRILTEEHIQIAEFDLNVSCKRMSSTNSISSGINGNHRLAILFSNLNPNKAHLNSYCSTYIFMRSKPSETVMNT